MSEPRASGGKSRAGCSGNYGDRAAASVNETSVLFFFLLFFIPPPPPPPPLLPPLSSRSASSPRFYPRVAGSSTRSFLRNGGLMRERRGVPRRGGRGSVRPEIPRRTGDLRAGSGVTSRDSGIYAWARVIQRQAVGDSRGCHC